MTTKIEWVINPDGTKGETWNPITGCTKVSPGCRNCYAERMARRLAGRHGYPEAPNHFSVRLHPSRLAQPLKWCKPRTVFVCSMGDLFHEAVPDRFIARVLTVMGNADQHTYQILTKKPDRMKELFSRKTWHDDYSRLYQTERKNWWFGVSVENQATADKRREYLRSTPAAIKYVSYEPALGPVDWTGWEFADQIISGGESGPKARPSHPDWHRLTRDFCQQHNIAYFFKQHGAWTAEAMKILTCKEGKAKFAKVKRDANDEKGIWMAKVGKKEPGRLLDGREWSEFPSDKSS